MKRRQSDLRLAKLSKRFALCPTSNINTMPMSEHDIRDFQKPILRNIGSLLTHHLQANHQFM